MVVDLKRRLDLLQLRKLWRIVIPEKRKEARYPTDDPAEIRILPSDGDSWPATVIDISRSGLRLELQRRLVRGMRIEIVIMPRKLTIYGQIRYCRRSDENFHVGVLVQDMFGHQRDESEHLDDDLLSLYLLGRGLTVPEFVRVQAHLTKCEECCSRLQETTDTLKRTQRA